MRDRKTYNDKNKRGEFPKPGVPADDAWKQMHAMLVENNLTQTAKKDKRRLIVFWFLIFFVATGVTGYLFYNSAHIRKISKNESIKTKTTNNDVVLNYDTIGNKIAGNDTINNHLKNDSDRVRLHTLIVEDVATSKTWSNKLLSNNTIIEQKNNDITRISNEITNDTTTKQISIDNLSKNEVETKNDSISNNKIIDTSPKNSNADSSPNAHKKITSARNNKFHFGLEWNANFSLKNNSNYFDSYKSGKQYYMWLLPSGWAKFDINKKHGVLVTLNPYQQQFTGPKTVHIEKPWIASVEPDIVTRVIKTNAINIDLNYTYQLNKRFSLQAGGGYSFIQNVLYKEQSVDELSGNILSEKIYGAKKKDAGFNNIKPSYLNWNIGVEYDIKKISIGAGLHQSFKNISSDSNYNVRPLNGSIYLRYRFK